MCGRYTLRSTGVELQNELGLDEPPMLSARYNIAPTQAALVVTDAAPRTVTVAQWGLIPHWAKDPSIAHRLLNARSEGIQTSRAFKGALEQRRCLVVADGFYEWKHHGKTRTPSFITLQSGRPFTFAGLWETFSAPGGADVTSFTIITTEANQFMSTLHERMPVILGREARALWLQPGAEVPKLLSLLEPWQGEQLSAIEVSPHVNSVAVDDPACIAPATQVQLSLL